MAVVTRQWLRQYASAVLAIFLATVIRRALEPILGERSQYVLFLIAVSFTAWYGGLRPALLSLVLCGLAVEWFVLPPREHGPVELLRRQVSFTMFVVAGLAIALLGGAARAAQERAEEALERERRQREQLRVTLQSLGEAVIVVGRDGLVSTINTVAEQLTGWSGDAAVGQPLKNVLRTVDEDTFLTDEAPVAQVLRDGRIVRTGHTTILLARDGTRRSVECSTAPIRDQQGGPTGVVITFQDVTERKQADERLRQSEQRFSRFMQHLPGLAWIKDADGRYVYANDSALKAFGTNRQKLYGRSDGEIFPAATATQFRANDRRALASSIGIQTIESLEHPDRVLHHSIVHKFPIPGSDATGALVGGIAIDITSLMRAEEALRASEAQFRTLADSIPQLAWMAGPDGSVFWFNKRWYDYTGTESGAVVGWGWERVHDIGELPRVRERFQAAIAGGEPWEDTVLLRRHDGKMRWHLSRAVPVRDEAGRVARWFGTHTDITDRMQMEAALKEADRRKDEFLATLAHELRNPLAPIRNALYLMRRAAAPGEGFEQERGIAERQVTHLARLIDDLMDVARIGRGLIELRKETVDLITILNRAIESTRSSLESRGHTLTIDLPEGPLLIEADPTRMEQVFGNLLNNAAKYTDPGGRVVISAHRDGDGLVVRIRDSGIGIEPQMLPHIFGMFVQAGKDSSRTQEGLGIGLSLVKTFVEMHGGEIVASSAGAGQGSEFRVRLPGLLVPTEGNRLTRSRGGEAESAYPRRKILVVDDNLDSARTMAIMLRRLWGQIVEVAHEGLEAIEKAERFRPDLVLLDIGLPEIDGHEVARRLRAQPELAGMIIVAMTGWGQAEDRRRSHAAGFDHHLVKPVDPDDVQRLLAELGR